MHSVMLFNNFPCLLLFFSCFFFTRQVSFFFHFDFFFVWDFRFSVSYFFQVFFFRVIDHPIFYMPFDRSPYFLNAIWFDSWPFSFFLQNFLSVFAFWSFFQKISKCFFVFFFSKSLDFCPLKYGAKVYKNQVHEVPSGLPRLRSYPPGAKVY
jgi:hypothetical protein